MILALLMADPVVMDGSVAELPGAFAYQKTTLIFSLIWKDWRWGEWKKGRNNW